MPQGRVGQTGTECLDGTGSTHPFEPEHRLVIVRRGKQRDEPSAITVLHLPGGSFSRGLAAPMFDEVNESR